MLTRPISKFALFILSGFLLAATVAQASRDECAAPFVVLVSVDGLGDHLLSLAIESQGMPEVARLIALGQKASRVETTPLMKTLPGHASMVTGLSPSRHGITFNDADDDERAIDKPTLFSILGRRESAAVIGKRKLRLILGGDVTISQPEAPLIGDLYGRWPPLITKLAEEKLQNPELKLLFVHYAVPDTTGHWFHWESWPQLFALRAVDQSISEIWKAALRKNPRAVLIITADHGGHGGSHGQRKGGVPEDAERDLFIPWIVVGAKLRSDFKTMNIIDTAPSVLDLLGLPVPKDWEGASRVERPKCN